MTYPFDSFPWPYPFYFLLGAEHNSHYSYPLLWLTHSTPSLGNWRLDISEFRRVTVQQTFMWMLISKGYKRVHYLVRFFDWACFFGRYFLNSDTSSFIVIFRLWISELWIPMVSFMVYIRKSKLSLEKEEAPVTTKLQSTWPMEWIQ